MGLALIEKEGLEVELATEMGLGDIVGLALGRGEGCGSDGRTLTLGLLDGLSDLVGMFVGLNVGLSDGLCVMWGVLVGILLGRLVGYWLGH